MDLSSKDVLKNLLEKYETHPSKKFGQNFLIHQQIVQDIIDATDISPNDTILEIGPGIGTLTQKLCQKAKKVIAVEKDEKMVEILKDTLKEFKNVEIIHDDILSFKFPSLPTPPKQPLRLRRPGAPAGATAGKASFKIVGSLPFYIATHIIRQFLETDNLPKKMVLVVQKEVGKRICAQHPNKMNMLANAVQFYSEPKIIRYISKRAFSPQPKVDSAIIKITNIIPASHEYRKPKFNKLFFKILKAGFAHPRKQLIGNLSKGLNIERAKVENWLLENNIQPNQRAETLSVQNWIDLTKSFKF